MDIKRVLMEYDAMFGNRNLSDIDKFLEDKIDEANSEGDYYSLLSLLNEHMGFCRDTTNREKGLVRCEQVVALLGNLGLAGTVDYATSLINVANAYRAFGVHDKSLNAFLEVERIYIEKLKPGEYNFASLYNNWSLLYQEMGYFEQAAEKLKMALAVIDRYPDAYISQAVTRSNLAITLLRISKLKTEKPDAFTNGEIEYREAMTYLMEALKIFDDDGGKDFHYSAALAAMGDALYMKEDYTGAIEYYEHALSDIERHVGQNDNYHRVNANLEQAKVMRDRKNKAFRDVDSDKTKDIGINKEFVKLNYEMEHKNNPYIFNNNMERCEAFYRKVGAKMIHEYFPEYEERIAVGLVGEGSDCFEFDDSISMDHDYEVGFCMWLNQKDYVEIGEKLQGKYDELVHEKSSQFLMKNDLSSEYGFNKFIGDRRRVKTIDEFYEELLGKDYLSDKSMLATPDSAYAAATNGRVFRDDAGEFTARREEIKKYYPQNVWKLKIAKALHDFSQYAQSNYPRMMARRDYVTANLCIAKGTESAMELCYLLNRQYAPYYKWLKRGFENLSIAKEVEGLLAKLSKTKLQSDAWENYRYNPYELNKEDKVVVIFEEIAEYILNALCVMGLAEGNSTFLEGYVNKIIAGAKIVEVAPKTETSLEENTLKTNSKSVLVEEIVLLEWEQFDKVKNEGGRADCQNDWNTFSLMRRSQYMAWNEELLNLYKKDLEAAVEKGWNLIMEKYARMMKSTAPEKYEELKESLPALSEGRIDIQEEIIKIQIGWMESFAVLYPKMAGNSRSIHTSEDTEFNTSYETYLRGELGTYSEETFVAYGRFIVELKKAGENLAYNIMDNTAKAYGYKDVADAEAKL